MAARPIRVQARDGGSEIDAGSEQAGAAAGREQAQAVNLRSQWRRGFEESREVCLERGDLKVQLDVKELLAESSADLQATTKAEAHELAEAPCEASPVSKLVTETKSRYTVFGVPVAEAALEAGRKQALAQVVFRDDRWDKALGHLRAEEGWGQSMAEALLCEGAGSFGFWSLSAEALGGLTAQLLGGEQAKLPSAALSGWLQTHTEASTQGPRRRKTITLDAESDQLGRRKGETTLTKKDLQDLKSSQEDAGWKAGFQNGNHVKICRWLTVLFVFLVSNAYAIKVCVHMYPDLVRTFGWPVYVARAGGMAAAMFTALLYLTMSRTLLTKVSRCLSRCGSMAPSLTGLLLSLCDAHKEMHVLSAKAMLVTGVLHVFGHLFSTIPALLSQPVEKLNALLGCANPKTTPGYMPLDLEFLQWPRCPLEANPKDTLSAIFTTMPGLTGILLIVVLSLTAYTGRQMRRAKHFDCFWYVHQFTIVAWPVLLFLHGSNSWIGLGVPLVLLTSSVPMATYAVDRIGRMLRYALFAGRAVKIVSAVVRPGKKGGAEGALSYIQISRPPFLWDFRAGMYAFVCVPEIAPLQWHPFTICSGPRDDTVDFLVAGVGDWTRELATRCMAASEGTGKYPKIAIDGPYAAPTQSASSKKILIAVGAGVGITPFLSLLSTLISDLAEDEQEAKSLVEAHFFWTTRSADEYFFGRKLFAKIADSPHLRDRIFMHLHVTSTAPDKEPASYLFREAVRRQSLVDQAAFRKATEGMSTWDLQNLPIQLPWCWMNGSFQDVIWVRHLLEEQQASKPAQGQRWLTQMSMMLHPASSDERTLSTASSETRIAVRSSSTCSSASTVQPSMQAEGSGRAPLPNLMPISFGRPDILTEIDAIGTAHPDTDIDIYACCNAVLVKELRNIALVCNRNAQATAGKGAKPQRYAFHYERFG